MPQKTTILLADYQAPTHRITQAHLTFTLQPEATQVQAILTIETLQSGVPLQLDGEVLELVSVALDGQLLASSDYIVTAEALTIPRVPQQFTLEIVTQINPKANTDLEGLFISGGHFCTQCEPHGFRRMTYFIDRPDNMSHFTTTIIADQDQYPVLLSNGNCVDQGKLANNQHFATWDDPFLKPSYLFALVAGKLDVLEDYFMTMSGRRVELKLFVDPGQLDRAQHAMDSLKKSMAWDEQQYGREYDLDIFMIVAVRDFNMGAMENKGLNIFNSKYILANPETATDSDYEGILEVVGHEYFHNWSGNRVTCRDWFQLSLKEGFTVFRDQTFTADHTSEAIKRVDDINLLRTHQFSEAASPTAHPVQPQSYMEINNFYTMTIYHKGAEVIRMMHTLLGPTDYRKGTDLYFQRHDGQAVTIEEFVRAMEDAGKIDLQQFRLWYQQAGTPELTVTDEYDAAKQQYHLIVQQNVPATLAKTGTAAMHIPLAVGLLNQQGHEIVGTQVLQLTKAQQCFTFDNIAAKPVPSLLRGFSAPVTLHYSYTDAELALLLAHDTDVFARYEAGQEYAIGQIKQLMQAIAAGKPLTVAAEYLNALHKVASSKFSDPALQGLLLTLPTEKYLIGLWSDVNPEQVHQARQFLRLTLAKHLHTELLRLYQSAQLTGTYRNQADDNGKRRLKNTALSYLSLLDNGELAWQQYSTANNMTDSIAALGALANSESLCRQQALDDFYLRWQKDPNVLDKWFSVQATSHLPGALERVKALQQSERFDAKNPNAIRALIGSFSTGNIAQFHAADGSGYQFLAEQVLTIDAFNKLVAARLVTPLLEWRKYDQHRQMLMRAQLEKILAEETLSKNTYEVVSKAL